MVPGCSKSCTISTSTSQKEAGEEAGAARGGGGAVRQGDVVHHEAGVVAEEALEVIVVAEALGAAEAQEGSAVVVAVAEDSEDLGEVVVVSEGHDIVFMYVKHKLQTYEWVGIGWEWERTWSDHLKITSSLTSWNRPSRNLAVGRHGLGSQDRIVTEYSFPSVNHVMTHIEDNWASIESD